jgi:hypothetical protein
MKSHRQECCFFGESPNLKYEVLAKNIGQKLAGLKGKILKKN